MSIFKKNVQIEVNQFDTEFENFNHEMTAREISLESHIERVQLLQKTVSLYVEGSADWKAEQADLLDAQQKFHNSLAHYETERAEFDKWLAVNVFNGTHHFSNKWPTGHEMVRKIVAGLN